LYKVSLNWAVASGPATLGPSLGAMHLFRKTRAQSLRHIL